jgi:hypothetical protein
MFESFKHNTIKRSRPQNTGFWLQQIIYTALLFYTSLYWGHSCKMTLNAKEKEKVTFCSHIKFNKIRGTVREYSTCIRYLV